MTTSASAMMATRFSPPRPAVVDVKLNVRSAASRSAPRVARKAPGDTFDVEAVVRGESFLGQDQWFQIANTQLFVWSGGVTLNDTPAAVAPPAAGAAPDVDRRQDLTIKPLSPAAIEQVFGKFDFKESIRRPGFIDVDTAWIARNIVSITIPALADLGFRALPVHAKAERHFKAVFDEIESSGLSSTLLSCGGTFVPRHIGRDVKRALSSHSWGIAIDLNVDWNGYNQRPALPGQIGSLREVVPIFAAHGFAWGGHFGTSLDGMHFELARRDP